MVPIKTVVIVGGGTAGWLTALSLVYTRLDIKCIVIDSSKIETIGVGEGTTGLFLDYLTNFGISFDEIFRETNASPKYGINFINWSKDKKEFISPIDGSYFPQAGLDLLFFGAKKLGIEIDKTSRCGTLIKNKKTDLYFDQFRKLQKKFSNPALHVDTYKTIDYLKRKSIEKNCQHIDSEVLSVNLNSQGNIESLTLSDGTKLPADIFIDCTGFKKILLKELDPTWIDYSDYLPVNSALTFKFQEDNFEKNLYTTARALNSGWLFEIPTRYRIGRGYIYSDKFINEEQVTDELEKLFNTKIEKVKSIKFNSGRLENVWIKNCLAVGLSASFLEPLQATSIHCTIVQIQDFITNCILDTVENTLNPINIKKYNKRISDLYSSMLDFISMHYSGGREDTPFWLAVKNEFRRTDFANEIIQLAKIRLTRQSDFHVHAGFAGPELWNYSLDGLDHFDINTISKTFSMVEFDYDNVKKAVEYYNQETNNLTVNCLTLNELNKALYDK